VIVEPSATSSSPDGRPPSRSRRALRER
jgi:hypothetical protein